MDNNFFDKTVQMSHLLATNTSIQGIETIIMDILFEASNVTLNNLKTEIQNRFKISIDQTKIKKVVDKLVEENKLYCDGYNIIISPNSAGEVSKMIKYNQQIEDSALQEWINELEKNINGEISAEDITLFMSVILTYVKNFFLCHGVDSLSLIINKENNEEFDIKDIVDESLKDVEQKYKEVLKEFLLNIFSYSLSINQKQYCFTQIYKAVSYLSLVANDDIKEKILEQIKDLTIYLDTPILYRLLDLQGESRFATVKTLIDYCRENNIILKILQTTYDELQRRISYDAKIILTYPTTRSLDAIGYKFRTSDNYISTFWRKSKELGISAKDFNFVYSDLKGLIEKQGIIIDNTDYIKKYNLEEQQAVLDRKVYDFSFKDDEYNKTEKSIEHDAICLATIENLREPNASSAINSKVVFLSSDWSLIRLQRYDHDYKNKTDLVVLPSQIMQLFCITQATESFYEAFLGLFSSSKTYFGTKTLSNNDIQEILGRIAMHKGNTPEFAEKVLANQLIQNAFLEKEVEEKEKHKLIDDVMLIEVKKMQSEIEAKNNEIKVSKEENTNKDDEIQDMSNRITALEKSKNMAETSLNFKDNQLTKYETQIKRICDSKSKIMALLRVGVGDLFILFGVIWLAICILALIPWSSKAVAPIFNWIKSATAVREETLNSITLIAIICPITITSIAAGLHIYKPGYKKLKAKYYKSYIEKMEVSESEVS